MLDENETGPIRYLSSDAKRSNRSWFHLQNYCMEIFVKLAKIRQEDAELVLKKYMALLVRH